MERTHITAEIKAEIVRELLENQVSAAELSERYKVNVNSIYNWRKQLFEAASEVFSGKRQQNAQKDQTALATLREQLRDKDSLIAELAQDNIALKKKASGMK